jgi:hypothetical protein
MLHTLIVLPFGIRELVCLLLVHVTHVCEFGCHEPRAVVCSSLLLVLESYV